MDNDKKRRKLGNNGLPPLATHSVNRNKSAFFNPILSSPKMHVISSPLSSRSVTNSKKDDETVPREIRGKIVSDPVHGSLELSACLWEIIDTPQFQRLRKLKQLGATHFVYPGAQHTRFEHSIGVAHLATELVKRFRDRQQELNINDADVLCVGIAGLCHDLGHGPFSHLFDDEFIKGKHEWTHEVGSVKMFDFLLEKNGINLEKYGLSGIDLTFIRELILGKKLKGGIRQRKGRQKSKAFLYEIVNNERNGLDVDKLDYMMRDSYYTGVQIKMGTDTARLIMMAQVLPDENGVLTITFPEKAVFTMYCVFQARFLLHRSIYQHPKVKACEYMIRDIFLLANEHVVFKNDKGQNFHMSDAINDMSVYEQLNDSILDIIEHLENRELEKAKHLLGRLNKRRIYRFCGEAQLSYNPSSRDELAQEITEKIIKLSYSRKCSDHLSKDDLIVEVMRLHHGRGDHNPVDQMLFFTKHQQVARKLETQKYGGAIMPTNFEQTSVRCVDCIRSDAFRQYDNKCVHRVFSRTDEKHVIVTECFKDWAYAKRMPSPFCHNSQQMDSPLRRPPLSHVDSPLRQRPKSALSSKTDNDNVSDNRFDFLDDDNSNSNWG